MRIYVEKYDKYDGFLLVDFVSIEEYYNFCKIIDRPLSPNDSRTMLYIDNIYFTSGKLPVEGSVYILPDEFLTFNWSKEPGYIESTEAGNFSDIFSFRTHANYRGECFINSPITFKPLRVSKPNDWNGKPCGLHRLTNEIELVVRDVGQGNWNELYSNDECMIIFDIGTSIHISGSETRMLIDSGKAFNGTHRPSLIISHWDIDHYKGIFQLKSSEINDFCCVFAPDILISETSKRAFKALKDNNSYIVAVAEITTRKVKRKISTQIYDSGNNYVLFQGEKASNRNHSGLSLAVWNQEAAILTGDSSYYQVFENMIPELPNNSYINLVTPHHGGQAGSINSASFNSVLAKFAITSTGRNSYGHPFNSVRQQLSSLGFQWTRTDHLNSDITIKI